MLQVDSASVHYGRVQAVRGVSLIVEPGEIVALLGPNGAGKSSLLRSIMGLQALSEGRIFWDGQRLDHLAAHQVAFSGVALVPEGRQLLPTMTVQDNLILGGYRHHSGHLGDLMMPFRSLAKRQDVQDRMSYVFDLFPRLQERQKQLAGSLSGGEQQMLAIGRALMSSPKLLVLDEPSIGLAPNLVQEILRLLRRMRDEGLTILLVEQDAHAALRVSDRGYVMETGRVVHDGTARELLSSERMRRAYLGKS